MHTYTPVPYDFKETIAAALAQNSTGKIFYFCETEFICEYAGTVQSVQEIPGEGEYLIHTHGKIRIDKIITLFGKPGPAYDEYERYGNSCMDCTAGFEPNDPRLE